MLLHNEQLLASVDLSSLTPGRAGELHLGGPTVFSGYLQGEQRPSPFDEDGYLCTGDLFEIAAEKGQFLHYRDRAKDLIIRGGMNIAPADLEGLTWCRCVQEPRSNSASWSPTCASEGSPSTSCRSDSRCEISCPATLRQGAQARTPPINPRVE